MKWCIKVLFVVLLLAGCSRHRQPEARKPETQEINGFAEVNEVFVNIDRLYQEGNIDEALSVVEKALGDDKYSCGRVYFFRRMLSMLLDAGRVDEARGKYLETIATDEELTRGGFGIIYGYYRRNGEDDALIAWTKTLVDSPLPEDLLKKAFDWQIKAYCKKGQFDDVLDLVPVCVKRLNGPECYSVLSGLVQSVLASKQYDNAGRLLRVLEKESGNRPELQRLAAVLQTDILFLKGRWVEAEMQFIEAAPGLPDEKLASCLNRYSSIAIKEDQLDLVDRLCGFVLKNQKSKYRARQVAAAQCIAVGRQHGDVGEIPRRLELLMQVGLPPKELSNVYQSQFEFVIRNGSQEHLKELLRFGDRLFPLLKSKSDQKDVISTTLDLTFITEDYERSLKILDILMTKHDKQKQWHDMAVNKIKAHIALKQGNKKEAVERFREFMKYISNEEEPQYNPLTDLMNTREMCLGFNAKRIGDILSSIGDEKGAKKAYKEAKAYYEHALKETKPDEKEYKHIKRKLAKIPAPKKSRSNTPG